MMFAAMDFWRRRGASDDPGVQFSAECNPPAPARKAMFMRSGLPGTVQPVPTDNKRWPPLYFVLTLDNS
jgi:hypothetical protein